ncbi:E3 ubiquitin-protein ligase MBR2 [Zea mays]|uniref:E3 ubiquitin-protein ligase MBR2 n=1 Tax=Zea mays TaxID=4577 RepID=A0A1D6LYM7_MAIZE|nr:E3 ubiquitin-protein ligase MBR2 [Zea mays]AQK84249.1 E3 ubiquitin-protein ligase MBR2 [Zea mays]
MGELIQLIYMPCEDYFVLNKNICSTSLLDLCCP